jgi:thioredoxin-dependent peroxiredoxin
MQPGDEVPDFELLDQNGKPRRLSVLLADGPVVLFFYPVASSTGCTKESCHFRDLGDEYAQAGAQRIGISPDSVEAQLKFAQTNRLDYPLLSDPDGSVSSIFGVKRKMLSRVLPVKRKTFVIGDNQRLIEVISSELNMDLHADEALKVLARQRT